VSKFTVCALLYGDHFDLATRCLEPLLKAAGSSLINLRLGLNEVCQDTLNFVKNKSSESCLVFEASPQIYKYPMMRKMLYDVPVETEYFMWFDDDSFIKENVEEWFCVIEKEMQSCDMLGSVYTISYSPQQMAWAKTQPWYSNKTINPKPKFATGGWWCVRTDLLRKHDWPIPQLKHSGGDVALGVLIEQQGYRLKHFNKGVAINANAEGKESSAARRGFSGKEKPIGTGFRVDSQ